MTMKLIVSVVVFCAFLVAAICFYDDNNLLLVKDDLIEWRAVLKKKAANIDVLLEQQVPRLIVAGTQKGGTSALGTILSKQKNFKRQKREFQHSGEAHFFCNYIHNQRKNKPLDGLTEEEWQGFLQDEEGGLSNKVLKALRRDYLAYWDLEGVNPRKTITFEKSPMYMMYPGTPALVKKVTPWAKIVIILREPVSRSFSHYKMTHSKNPDKIPNTTNTFTDYIAVEVESLRQQGVSQAPSIHDFSKPDFQLNPETAATASSFKLPHNITKRRSLHSRKGNPWSMLYRGMYAELLSAWMEHFELGKNVMVLSYEYLKDNHLAVVNDIQRFVGVKETLIREEVLTKAYHKTYGMEITMTDTERRYLEHFFQPYNQELLDVMGEEWFNKYVGTKWTSSTTTIVKET